MKTRQRPHWAAFGLLLALAATPPEQAHAEQGLSSVGMVRVKLPAGISLELPKEWNVHSSETGRVFDISRRAVVDLSGLTWNSLGHVIIARSGPASSYALVSVAFQRRQTYTQDELRRLSSAELDSEAKALRRTLEDGFAAQGMGSLEWMGARRESLRNTLALVAEYRRRLPDGAAVWVQINHIPLGGRILSLTLAYREMESLRWRPVVHRVRESLRVE